MLPRSLVITGFRYQATWILAVAAAFWMLPSFASSSSKQAQKQVEQKKEDPPGVKAVKGLKRQGKGGMGNENANKKLKELEAEEKGGSQVSSGDKTKAKK